MSDISESPNGDATSTSEQSYVSTVTQGSTTIKFISIETLGPYVGCEKPDGSTASWYVPGNDGLVQCFEGTAYLPGSLITGSSFNGAPAGATASLLVVLMTLLNYIF
ncbi:hypothetical protein CXQ85_004555 [Candidozyma haemuli]|uniref:Uncharacterized protein n=1 Tax=Candidozyma haemuli TaxID=45357 RepID=A0A2V1AYH6_9ASCO|nr:hypothetical protein CXQ85_004555 [[Candida] haemuloni]PVH21891.1 hypothetical protein CXQ85_004555 [[Candida] haemuloni]